jgi:enoyl-CoA hydratase/carnithine racemase
MQMKTDPSTILVSAPHAGVVTVRLNREAVLNAFDERMIEELTTAFEGMSARADVRAIVLESGGAVFCAGADLQWMRRASVNDQTANLQDARRFARMMQAVRFCPKPTVARVQGHVFGGGVGLCAACDIVVASSSARFSVSEARFGILPAVIGPYLVEALGQRQARRPALTAEQISAAQAMELGLVHQVVDEAALDDAIEVVTANLRKNGPQALEEVKKFFDVIGESPKGNDLYEYSAKTISRVRGTAEAKEGFAAFFDKRPASWIF